MATATANWGDIGSWNVSGVKDFNYAFSKHRDKKGGTESKDSNLKAVSFVGTAMSKWITTSLITLRRTFYGADAMNSDLSGWNVANVKTLKETFSGASKFDSDLSAWNVAKVKTLGGTFAAAHQFAGTGLDSWITTSLTTLYNTFIWGFAMNADLSGWSVAKVHTLEATFRSANKFVGTGLSSWNTAAVISLLNTFNGASKMDADLGSWDSSAFVQMTGSFKGASSFAGIGLRRWDVAKETIMNDDTLAGTKLDDCTKKRIASAWRSNDAFDSTGTPAKWAALVCPSPDDSRLTNEQIILVRQRTGYTHVVKCCGGG